MGLLGWLIASDALITVLPGQPPMMPNTAIGLILLGIAGAMLRPHARRSQSWLATLAALFVLAIGLGTIAEYAFGLQLGLDQLFIRTLTGPFPGRPSPPTATAFTCLSGAILMFDWRLGGKRVRPAEWLIVTAGLIAVTALLGQIFGAGPLYRLTHAPTIGVAVPTALATILISLGLLLQRPQAGLMRLFAAPGPGSALLLRLTPWGILAPVLVGLIGAHLLERPIISDVPLVFAALTVMTIVVTLLLLAITAERLNRTHEILEQTRAETRSLIDLASDGFFVSDLSGHYTDVNDAGCRMLGFSREELLGKTIVDLIRPEDVERLWADRTKFLEGQSTVSEWMLRRKDGTYFPAEVSAKILPDGRWTAIARDISERKRAEEVIRLSEEKFSGIVSSSHDAIISIDETQRITLFNKGAETMFGRSSVEMIGHSLDLLMPERFRADHPGHVRSFLAGPVAARGMKGGNRTVLGVRGNGEEFPIDAVISKISVGGKTVMTATLRDITEQTRLAKNRQLFADLGAVLSATLDTEKLYASVAQLVVRDLADLCIIDIIEDDKARRARVLCRDRTQEGVAAVLMHLGSSPNQTELADAIRRCKQPVLIEHPDATRLAALAFQPEQIGAIQSTVPNSAIVVPLIAQEKVFGRLILVAFGASPGFGAHELYIAGAFAERTALSLDNAQLFRSAKRATKARDDMLGIVAHDLRNPLQLIATHSAILHRTGSDPVRETADGISDAVGRMTRMIKDLLDVTSLDAGQLSLKRERINVSDLISDSIEAHEPIASAASLLIGSEAAVNLPAVWADRDRILQVLQNLIGNAMKFTKAGGRIVLNAQPGNGEIVFSVSDTGAGIPADALPHVFDRFWQAEKGSRRGAGLGLAIVKGIVEAHGGRVWVRSAVGQGSTFYFAVPTAEGARAPTPK
jgi:PAS domain S-box-containing protein